MIRVLSALVALALAGCHAGTSPPAQNPPTLYLLTGLPLAFGESFTLAAAPSPVMTALQRSYRVVLVDGPEGLPAKALLLAAQPRALTPERLVALDAWVRGGGRVLLLADPRLTWPSELPLGDKARPPYAFADTGLLAHWGLRSEGPDPGSTATVRFVLAGHAVQSESAGTLFRHGGPCVLSADARSAKCRLGRGEALVLADADFLRAPGGLEATLAALAQLSR